MQPRALCLALAIGFLASAALAGPAGAAFPGSNGRIVFVSDRDAPGSNGREIYTAAPDGSDPLRLTENSVPDTDPAYSPDGTKIAFTRSTDIWVMNADGTGQVAITGPEGPDSQPAWSPDGSRIVYVSNQNTPGGGTTGFELFVRNVDGSGTPRRLTETPNNVSSRAPAWSPAGDRVAYESNADGTFEIYTIDANASAAFGTRRSANELGLAYQNPSWSPDGARIAYERGIGTMADETTKEIWTMSADGSDPVRLTNNSAYDGQPAYSPDGGSIAYETLEGGDREIYTRGAGPGGTPANVTNTAPAAAEEQPDWGFGGPPAPPPPAGGGAGGGPGTPTGIGDPTLGVDVIVEPVSGAVLVGAPGALVKLTSPRRIPVGSLVDARRGKVRVISATGRPGERQSGTFSGGLFQVTQSKKPSAKGLTNLILKGSSFRGCAGKGARGASTRTIRRLQASAKGRFRVSARNSSATVGATVWQTEDRCDGTLTKVRRGRVALRDIRRGRSIQLRAGQSYLARSRG
jgi:dipeptidyl aminopeptidase/acylaminoacyl peptidase